MIRPIGKNLLVKVKSSDKPSIILLTNNNDEPFEAVLIDKGNKADLDAQIGDVLLLVPYSGSRINVKDDLTLLITEKDVLGVVIDDTESK